MENITLHMPPGTLSRLRSLRKATGLNNEDIFRAGLKFVFVKTISELEKQKAPEEVMQDFKKIFLKETTTTTETEENPQS